MDRADSDGWQSGYDKVHNVLKDNQLTIDGRYAINTIQPLLAPFSLALRPLSVSDQQHRSEASLATPQYWQPA